LPYRTGAGTGEGALRVQEDVRRWLIILFIVPLIAACAVEGDGPGAGEDLAGSDEAPPTGSDAAADGGDDELAKDLDRPAPDLDRVDSSSGAAVTGEVPEDALRPVLADASDRTGVATADLEVVRAQYVDWPDGSLGCPEPGMYYTQAIEPGYWVEVRADDLVLDYRLTVRGSFRLCESGLPGVPGDGGGGTGGPPDS
jgi:hypothetical protein